MFAYVVVVFILLEGVSRGKFQKLLFPNIMFNWVIQGLFLKAGSRIMAPKQRYHVSDLKCFDTYLFEYLFDIYYLILLHVSYLEFIFSMVFTSSHFIFLLASFSKIGLNLVTNMRVSKYNVRRRGKEKRAENLIKI